MRKQRTYLIGAVLSLLVLGVMFALPRLAPDFITLAEPLLCRTGEALKVTALDSQALLGVDVVCRLENQYREVNHWYLLFSLLTSFIPLALSSVWLRISANWQDRVLGRKRKNDDAIREAASRTYTYTSSPQVMVSHHVLDLRDNALASSQVRDIHEHMKAAMSDGKLDRDEAQQMAETMQGIIGMLGATMPMIDVDITRLATEDESLAEKLRELQDARDSGLITDEEYTHERQDILDRFS
ncbi:MAG: SHOCT domain-containing protein [bacterium]|nr:SHOCT domain-containing protein [bacterium]